MDRAPSGAEAAARDAIAALGPAVELRRLRMRQAGGRQFADVVIGVAASAGVGQGHAAADAVEDGAAAGATRQRRRRPRRARLRGRYPGARPCGSGRGAGGAGDPQRQPRRGRRPQRALAPREAPGRDDARARPTTSRRSSRLRSAPQVPELDAMQTHLEPLTEPAEGREVAGDAAVVERIVLEETGTGRVARCASCAPTRGSSPTSRSRSTRRRASTRRMRARARSRRGSGSRRRRSPMSSYIRNRHEALHVQPDGAWISSAGWPGRIDGDRIVQLAAQTLQAFFTGGGGAREHAEYPLAECELRAPVLIRRPSGSSGPSSGERRRSSRSGARFRCSGRSRISSIPTGTGELDYGLALAAVIGADGTIGGFTLANDWTARDLSRAEREAGFGPSKSSDFGLSLGPVVVTPDEVADRPPGRARERRGALRRRSPRARPPVARARRARGSQHRSFAPATSSSPARSAPAAGRRSSRGSRRARGRGDRGAQNPDRGCLEAVSLKARRFSRGRPEP